MILKILTKKIIKLINNKKNKSKIKILLNLNLN